MILILPELSPKARHYLFENVWLLHIRQVATNLQGLRTLCTPRLFPYILVSAASLSSPHQRFTKIPCPKQLVKVCPLVDGLLPHHFRRSPSFPCKHACYPWYFFLQPCPFLSATALSPAHLTHPHSFLHTLDYMPTLPNLRTTLVGMTL